MFHQPLLVMPTYDCGHGCSITCKGGGGCVYNHSTGKCSTFCNDEKGALELKSSGDVRLFEKPEAGDARVEVKFDNVSPAELARVLREVGVLA